MRGATLGVRAGLLATAAVTALLFGCGGSDDDDSSASAAGDDSATVQECLSQAGIPVTPEAPPSEHMIGDALYINVDQLNQVYVAFMDSPKTAQQAETTLDGLGKAAGGNAGAEVVGDDIILATAKETTSEDVDAVKSCLAR